MPIGQLAAQLTHASGESAALWARDCSSQLPGDCRAVVLAVDDEVALLDVAARLTVREVAHVVIREPDAPHLGAATAIGIVPTADRAPIRRVLSHLPLLR